MPHCHFCAHPLPPPPQPPTSGATSPRASSGAAACGGRTTPPAVPPAGRGCTSRRRRGACQHAAARGRWPADAARFSALRIPAAQCGLAMDAVSIEAMGCDMPVYAGRGRTAQARSVGGCFGLSRSTTLLRLASRKTLTYTLRADTEDVQRRAGKKQDRAKGGKSGAISMPAEHCVFILASPDLGAAATTAQYLRGQQRG